MNLAESFFQKYFAGTKWNEYSRKGLELNTKIGIWLEMFATV